MVTIIREAISYGTSGISLPEARKMIEGVIDLVMENVEVGRYSTMATSLETGW
jgi:hypothetical protein